MSELKTKIGLEIHVQLATKSKMFCRCDNEAFGKKPNTTVCPICLGMPGTLPVANEEAIEFTLKTGLAFNCKIADVAKFDRKHYFYPDLPKGYQISQYDEPFCIGGSLTIDGREIRLNRIHLEEDAGKLIHSDRKSLVDLNRASTPLMEIVTEPDIASPLEAGAFLRKLQKIVRDVAKVSEASMEKGHLRCDANISVNDGNNMSEIVELKNINSFRFIEKALAIEEDRLKKEYPNWPDKKQKVTRGYDSKKNITYAQRQKEEAADYRYFPEPDLPPFHSSAFDLEKLKNELGQDEGVIATRLIQDGISEDYAKILIKNKEKLQMLEAFMSRMDEKQNFVAKLIVNNAFGFIFDKEDYERMDDYIKAVQEFSNGLGKQSFTELAKSIHEGESFEKAFNQLSASSVEIDLEKLINQIIDRSPNEVAAYRNGKTQLFGFFMGQIMRETKGKADPTRSAEVLKKKLG